MYTWDQILKGTKDPHLIGRELNRLYYTRWNSHNNNPKGINFLDEDWDNLLILDACRYDSFAKHADLSGTLEHRHSLGTATYEFIRHNFKNRKEYDVVYVGANTWFLKLQHELDSEIHHFVDLQNGDFDVDWVDKELKVVTPRTVTKHAKRINEKFPNKRLIIHYLQPHHPFIGQVGEKHFSNQTNSLREVVQSSDSEIDQSVIRKAYIENLEKVLSEVKRLIPNLMGKTVITSDHGEMLGERHKFFPVRDYGHPPGIYNKILSKVPWHIIDSNQRKTIQKDRPLPNQERDMEQVNQQLKNLGYST